MIAVKPLVDANLKDAKEVILKCFPADALGVLSKAMSNPARDINEEVGDIAYEDGIPIAFQAVMLRRVFWGQKPLIGHVSGLAGVVPGASFKGLMAVRKAAHFAQRGRGGCKIRFGNSHCASTEQLASVMKRIAGPESCTRFLWKAVRPVDCFLYFIRRKIFKASVPKWKPFDTRNSIGFRCAKNDLDIRRKPTVDSEDFDLFFERYLKTNKGLVVSRYARDINWIFEGRVKNGSAVVMMAYKNSFPCGYIVIYGGNNARRWQILDLIALDNDCVVLDALLETACMFLRKHTPAMMLETCGFQPSAQPVLRKHLPHARLMGVNAFSYNYIDKEFGVECERSFVASEGWFFGPFDGDLCM